MKRIKRVALLSLALMSILGSCVHDDEPEVKEFPVPQDMRRFMYALNITNVGVYRMPKGVATPKAYGWILPIPVDFGKTTLNIRFHQETVHPLYLSYKKGGKTLKEYLPDSGAKEYDGSIVVETIDEEEINLILPAAAQGETYNGVSNVRIMLKATPTEVMVNGMRTNVEESKFPLEIPLVILPGGWKDGISEYSIPGLYPVK